MLKRDYVIIVLIIIIGFVLDYLSFQKETIAEQKGSLSQLSERIATLSRDVSEESAKSSEMYNKYIEYDSIVKAYLKAEKRECSGDTAKCLTDLTTKITPSELVCDVIPDSICPRFCGLSLDYDCCIEKGYEWIAGHGCYSN